MTVSDQLRAERERLGLTPQQTADILEVSKRALNYWEEGRHPHVLTQEGALARLSGHGEKHTPAATSRILKDGSLGALKIRKPAKKGRAKR